jgi:hypothetical protein
LILIIRQIVGHTRFVLFFLTSYSKVFPYGYYHTKKCAQIKFKKEGWKHEE